MFISVSHKKSKGSLISERNKALIIVVSIGRGSWIFII
ncbi:unnamed protein product [Brassica oleracea var. botrytis]